MSLPREKVSGTLLLNLVRGSFIRQNQVIFSDLNWELKPNERWAIYGGVGAGKTTLVNALTGKLPLRSGKFEIKVQKAEKNEVIELNRSEFRSYTAIVSFQQQSFFDYGRAFYQQRYQSLESELAIPTVKEMLLQAHPDRTLEEHDEIIQLLQLSDLLPLQIIKLSNGQTRKLQIARALLQKPNLLILDNPFTGLDVASREELKQLISSLNQQGVQTLIATNQQDLPESVTHVLWLNDFKVKGLFTRASFYANFTAGHYSSLAEENAPSTVPLVILPKAAPTFSVAVKMEQVSIRYQGRIVLDNISWTVNNGDKWALVGPNGSGKSTLLSLIYADNPQAFANKITLFDRRKGSGESIWDIKKRIGFVSPELHLYFRQALSGLDVAATGFFDILTRPKTLSVVQEQVIREHFAYFNRLDLLTKSFLQLSAGEQRLILLIRSLVKNPDLIIWDEPFQGLSPEYISLATSLLLKYCTPETTLIMVSHYAQEIPAFVNQYLYLEAGKVVQK